MLPFLQNHLPIQYWDEFNLNWLLLSLMDRRSIQSRSFWIQIGWESISNTRSHMMDMERNTTNGCSGMICWRTWELNCLRIMNHSSMPNIPLQNTTRMRSGSELRDNGLSRKDKKTYSKT